MKFWEGSYLLTTQGSQREVTSFGLEFQWMLLVPYAVDVWFLLVKKSRSGSVSNMRDYRTYVIGVAALIMATRIVNYG